MPNLHKGEAEFTCEGVRYRLVLDLNAMAEAEEAADMGVDALMKAISPVLDEHGNVIKAPRLKHVGAILYGALRRHHPHISHADAINLLGESEDAGQALGKALEAAMPKPSAEGKGQAASGTGTKPRPTGRQKT